jgi:SAM-dependent methyltransferase
MSVLTQLHALRHHELERALAWFPAPREAGRTRTVLEIGAGTGHQARLIGERGYAITAVDLASSHYAGDRVHPVIDYDGRRLPAGDASFDVVFSSNVLEHVRDLDAFLDEIARVLVPGGIAVHILPTPAWRFWSTFTHYGWLAKRLYALVSPPPALEAGEHAPQVPKTLHGYLSTCFPLRHGERGTTVSELWLFSRRAWLARFRAHGYTIVADEPAGLFYTLSNVFGARIPLATRARLARVLGSACRLYVMSR